LESQEIRFKIHEAREQNSRAGNKIQGAMFKIQDSRGKKREQDLSNKTQGSGYKVRGGKYGVYM